MNEEIKQLLLQMANQRKMSNPIHISRLDITKKSEITELQDVLDKRIEISAKLLPHNSSMTSRLTPNHKSLIKTKARSLSSRKVGLCDERIDTIHNVSSNSDSNTPNVFN